MEGPDLNLKALVFPAPESIWRCPCGWEGKYTSVRAHRKGYRKRPQCSGDLIPVDPPYTPHQLLKMQGVDIQKLMDQVRMPGQNLVGDVIPESAVEQPELQEPPLPTPGEGQVTEALPAAPASRPRIAYEWRGDPQAEAKTILDDPEELARQFNLSSSALLSDIPPSGGGLDGSGDGLPPSDWHVQEPAVPPEPSQARETVTLPVIVRVMYDYAKSEGWKLGDNSLSTFITDCLMDYWNNILGKGVFVLDRKEVLGG